MDSRLFVLLVCWWSVLPDKSQGQICICNSTSGGCDYTNQCVPVNSCRKENVALGKYASLSSVYTNNKYPACQAVNGNIGRQYVPNGDTNSNCANSGDVINSRWQVDLGKNYTIDNIIVYTMDKFETQMYGVLITVDGISCYNITSSEIPEKLEVPCNPPLEGQHVQFLKYAYTGNDKYIAFCEVQVWVCIAGFFGPDCDQTCGRCKEGPESCDRYSGDCPSGCEDGFLSPTCKTACNPGSYGANCKEQCGHCLRNTVCNTVNGTCEAGCTDGFAGSLCKDCSPGSYGANCKEQCGHCQNNSVCNTVNGTCESGCKDGFAGNLCKVCDEQHYGYNCTNKCGHCSGGICNNISGVCTQGCLPGYWNITCNQECNPGSYGANCNEQCGHCQNNTVCNTVNGTCDAGCKDGFAGNLCKVCDEQHYGYNCTNKCGHCFGGICNNISGECAHGCLPGYLNTTCNQVCAPEWYGANCTEHCGHCQSITSCNHENGTCDGGCSEGFAGSLCKDCADGYSGNACITCGQCIGKVCDKHNGHCPGGCMEGWTNDTCTQAIIDTTISDEPISDGAVAGITVGVIAAVMAIVGSIVIFIRWRRHKYNHTDQRSTTLTDHVKSDHISDDNLRMSTTSIHRAAKPKAAVKPHNYSKTRDEDEPDINLYSSPVDEASEKEKDIPPVYRNVQPSNVQTQSDVNCLLPQSRLQNVSSDVSVSASSAIKIEGVSQVYENVAVNKKRPEVPTKPLLIKQTIDKGESQDDFADDTDVIYRNEDIYATYTSVKPQVQMDEFKRSLLASLASGLLSKQFKELPRGTKHPCSEGIKPENLKKNRFKALCPYDHTRVKLQRPEGDKENDYINASFIKGYQREKAYIAAQGPRTQTVDDMWLMIWQENVTQIVMLTNLREDGKEKCEEYWPATGATQTYGHVSVTGLNVEQRADFIIRTFSLRFQDKPFQRQVDQYHFVAWPDHGVPTASSLVNFWRYIKERALPNVPLLVHCSAGVGRTGTYIALDIAMEMAARRRDVNVHNIVVGLRADRSIMVQAEAQYKFLYEVILEAYTSRASRLTFDQFEVMFTDVINIHEPNDVIDKEFKVLQQMGEYVSKPSNDVATAKENLAKNRNPNVLPDDKFLAYLSVPVQGRNFYINAVFLSSFKHQRGIILTQLPLSDTLVDIWRLVDDKDVNTIVALISKNEEDLAEDFCQYWPKAAGEVLKIGPYSVMATTSTLLTKHVTSFHMQFKTKSRTRDVRLLHFWNWTGEVPEDTSDLIHLVENLHSNHPEEDHSPVLIQCIDGAAKSGLFCILWDIISRAMCDHEIDVYLAARHVQRVRPQSVTSQVQYRFCYRVAQDFQRHLGVYQNT